MEKNDLMECTYHQNDIKKIKDAGDHVVIFGAGIVGEVLLYACQEHEIHVDCFYDNNVNKTRALKCGIPVRHALDLEKEFSNAIVLISAADIKDVINQLQSLGITQWYPGSILLRNFGIYQHAYSAPMEFVEYAVDTCLLCHDSFLVPDRLFLRSVDIVITERCSLKCRGCSNLMQYYERPRDCSLDEIMRSIDWFCTVVDAVNEFRVIGGEPLMSKDFYVVMKRLIDEPKVKKVVVYTNGTLVPKANEIPLLQSSKALFMITDYGTLSRNLAVLIDILKENNIAFYAQKAKGWTDCSKIVKHGRSLEQQKEIFRNCCAKNTVTLLSGRLYRCPFVGNAYRLQAVPECASDYIDLFRESWEEKDILKLKKKIRAYLLDTECLDGCDYCNGRSFEDPEIEPAIQIKKPLVYERRYSGN